MRLSSSIQFVSVWAILLFTSLGASAIEFAGGTGEPSDPYLIATAEQLLTADFTVPETYFQLTNDIDLDGKPGFDFFEWPHYYDGFQAHLDGAGFEIRNAVCGATGIFGYIAPGATISNLTLTHVEVTSAAEPDRQTHWFPAGAFAFGNAGILTNCGVTGLVATWRVNKVGGFVGSNSGTIVNCFFDGWVMATWEYLISGDDRTSVYVGGLVSENYGDGVIANSVSRGTVLANMGAGGLVGYNGGTIRDSYSQCTVLAQVGAGGLVSDNWGSLDTCYAGNRVTGELRGGLVGLGGDYIGSASNCIWNPSATECTRSGAGVSVSSLGDRYFAYNGWAEDPNWVIPLDPYLSDYTPRLAWETEGTLIPEYVLPELEEGSGTEDDPYVIRTKQTLRALGEASIYWDKHFVLGDDIDMKGSSCTLGICSESSFSGKFDGNGHVIRGLILGNSSDSSPVWNGGLFGYLTGEVRNLALEDCKVIGGMNSRRIGLLAGTNAGTLTNCFVSGSITVGEDSESIGELVGYNLATINECDSLVTIEAGEGSTGIGGLIGENHFRPR